MTSPSGLAPPTGGKRRATPGTTREVGHTTSQSPVVQPPAGYFTIDIDTGGTFTDAFVTGPGITVVAKSDTTPHDPTLGVLNTIAEAASRLGLTRTALLGRTDIVRFSTTVGTNTLINRDGPNVGLLYDSQLESIVRALPAGVPLSPGLCIAVGSRREPAEILSAVRNLLDRGARLYVVALTRGPDLAEREEEVRQAILGSYPRHYLGALPVLMSHQICLVDDERVRIQTAVLDAYLHPVMSRFLYRVEDQLRAAGYRRPLLVANANGGTSRVAKTAALRTWGSGPAGGVAGAAAMAQQLQLSNAVAIDVGGTSTDICLIRDGRYEYEVQPVVDGTEVSLPVLSLESASMGGGTIARVKHGALVLGPDSAGAQPGPAAFGLGGEEATVTDAACVVGLFDPSHFLGGRKRLDVESARKVLESEVARPLGLSTDAAAWRILEAAASFIAEQIRAFLRHRGVTGQQVSLFGTGGAGGLLASTVARLMGATAAYAFPVSPAFSAFGLSRLGILHTYDLRADNKLQMQLKIAKTRATADMRTEGVLASHVVFSLEAESVGLGGGIEAQPLDLIAVENGQPYPDRARLIRLKAWAPARTGELPKAGRGISGSTRDRVVSWPSASGGTPVFDWDDLSAGSVVNGPAILETRETTVVIPPGSTAHIGSMGEARIVASAPS